MRRIDKTIYLHAVGNLDDKVILNLKNDLNMAFKDLNLSVETKPDSLELTDFEYNAQRAQYRASKILKKLEEHMKFKNYYRLLGITDEDIYTEGLNFVFGVAKKPLNFNEGIASLISVCRLREDFYNRNKDAELFRLRVLKEAVHELGHTFNLDHCDNTCVMRFSNSLRHTDEKPPTYCDDDCMKKVQRFISR
jgi:archaemetzincin